MAAHGPMLDALRGVRWSTRSAVAAAAPGVHRSRQRGTAGEFTEYRLYRQGDDPRALDWKLLARSDRAFVRLSEERALLPTWVVLDGSASMAFPEGGATMSKWQLACALAVGLSAVAHASGDPVGVLVAHGYSLLRMPPRTRRGTIIEIARALDAIVCGGDPSLAALVAQVPARVRCVILTDCLGDLDALIRQASVLVAGGAWVECVHVVAAAELTLPDAVYLARDPEHTERAQVLAPRAHSEYRARFAAFREETAQRWRGSGAGYSEVVTNEAPARAVRRVVARTGV